MHIMVLFNTRKKILAAILLVAVVMTIMPKVSFAANGTFGIEMLVSETDVYAGEVFTYTIKYSYSSGTTDAKNVVIVDQLPPELDFVEAVSSIDIDTVSETNGEVTFTFKDPLKAGTTGTLKIKAKFKEGVIPDNKTVLNEASINGTEVNSNESLTEKISNEVSVTIKDPVIDWYVEKVKVNPAGVPALNSDVKYRVTVHSNSVIGGLNLKDIVVTDTFEEDAVVVNAGGGIESDNTVTWNLSELNAGLRKDFFITLRYPSEHFSVNTEAGKKQTATNSVTVTAKNYDDSDAGSDSDSVNHNFADPSYSIGNFDKDGRPGISEGNDEYSLGQEAQFYIKGVSNTSNVAIQDFRITDNIPADIELTEISTGSFDYNDGVNVTVKYKTQIGSGSESEWKDWYTGSTDVNTTLDARLITLGVDERISAVQWYYGTVPAGFSLNSAGIKVFGTIISGTVITNTAYLDANDGISDLTTKQASETIAVISKMPWITASKSTLNGNEFYEEEYVEFKLEVTNHEYAPGEYSNPVIVEELLSAFNPATFEYLGWNDTSGTSQDINSPGAPDISESYDVNGNTCYKWNFTGIDLQPGESVAVRFKAQVLDGTLAGFVNNNMYAATFGDFKASTKYTDTTDIDDNASTSHLVKANKQVFVKFKGSLKSEKWVRGELDTVWSYYSNPEEFAHGQTLPGGIADYKLIVSNAGSNGPIANIVVIDVLPYIGDKELVSGNDRESTWRPNLVNQIEFVDGSVAPSGFKIWYSVEPEAPDSWQVPDLGQVENPADKSSYNTGWTETLPEDITTVRALKFDFGDLVLNSGEEIVLSWPMRAPAGAPKEIIAWNSFMYGATYPDVSEDVEIQEPFLKAEPQKVGFKIFDPEEYPANLGDFIWEDMNKNGIQDDGEPGINGVLVELFEEGETTPLKYTRSGDSYSNIANEGKPGYYLFPYLPTGKKYYVKFTLPTGYEDYLLTTYGQGTEATDSDVDPASVEMATELITLTGNNYDIDLGLYRKASIGDLVWNDRDMDGVQDSGEPGLSGITVELYDESNAYLNTTTTDANGNYKFSLLDPGKYYVKFINDGNYIFSPKDTSQVGTVDIATDSDADISTGYTDLIEIRSGDKIEDIDAGMYMAELGNLIWHDLNADGIKDSNESGIDGVTVKLFEGGSDTGKTCTTGSQGEYEFIDLVPGSYHIEVVNPGYDAISPLHSMGNDNDNDLNSGVTSTVSLAAGERYYKLDGGYYNYASVGDLIWNDKDHDGRQDGLSSEPGIENITVQLFDDGDTQIGSNITTGSNGSYLFSGLDPGEYYVKVTVPTSEYKVTGQNKVGDSSDSDIDASGRTANFTLISGENNDDIDAGLHKALIGDYVWQDMNADGIQNDGSRGIENVSVKLLDSSMTQIASTTTNSNGYYQFTDLDSGTYYVKFAPPAEFETTTKGVGTSSSDSDVNDADQTTDQILLDVGETEKTIDAGYWKPAKIGNYVWYEVDGDGLQGGVGEDPIPNVTVELYKDNNPFSTPKTTITAADGTYLFDDLIPGKYQVKFTLPTVDGYDGFIGKVGSDNDTNNSDVIWDGSSSYGLTIDTYLVSGEEDFSWDAGIYKDVIIGDYVWEDIDANGIQNESNTGINGVTVELYKKNGGTPVKTTTTADNSSSNPGYYEFTPLPPGEYYLKVVYDEDVYRVSPVDQLSDDTVDSDCARDTKKTADFQIDSTTENLSYDFGLYKKNSIGDKVWLDVNGDSIQNGSDTGVKDVKVYLLDTSNTVLDSMLTDSNGNYLFDNLDAGTYRIGIKKSEITALNGKDYLITEQDSGSDDNVDSDISQTETSGYCITGDYVLVSDNNNLSVDIGLYEPASIGDFVWDDLNANGIQDDGEPGINGVVAIKLYDADINKHLGSTSPINGIYKFEGLDAGNYYVEFSTSRGVSPQDIGSGPTPDENDSDIDTITKKTGIIALTNGEQNEDVDAGFYIPASIGNIVWHDVNGDGKQGSASSEPRINGVTVALLNSSNTEITTCITGDGTLDDGEYLFENLVPGDYRIKVDLSTAVGFDGFTDQDIGSDDTEDSDVDENGLSPLTALISDEDDMSWDAGLYKSVTIGDYIWEDIDADGIQENRPFEGIDVTLVRVIDSIYTVVDTMTTGVDGKYLFTDQKPGEFYVEIDKPSNYRITVKDEATTDDDNDSDANLNNARTDDFNVESGNTDLSRDIGLYLKNTLGDKVWLDNNGDGLQTSENGIAGIKVYLYKNNSLVTSVTTDAEGNYLFDNLDAGTYDVRLVKSDIEDLGYTVTEPNVNLNSKDGIDSDLDADTFITTETYTFVSDDHNITVDIGLYKLATIGDYVWDDKDGDGIQDEIAAGIEDIKVELYDLGDNLVKETTTDSTGLYQITGIVPGDYYVKFTAPSNYVITQQNIDADNTDSDINSEGKTATITLKSGDSDVSIDAGYYIPIIIGDKIWEDNDANGLQNDGDSGINGVLVELYQGTTKVESFTTGSLTKGEYRFTGLAPGSYHIKVSKPDEDYIFSDKGTGTDNDSDVDINTGESSPKTYVSGDIDLDIDAGMYRLVSIGDKVWLDDDADGLQDGGESGINDVTVRLYQDDVYSDSVTTAGDGDYEFTDLMPGNYSIEVIKDSNYYFTTQDKGSDDGLDSDINPATSKSVTKFVPSSSIIDTWDGGLYLENSIGDKVWLDENGNGQQDDGEPGINGVTVKLYKSGVTDPIATYETGSGLLAEGEYLFENLEAGTYTIGVDRPTGYHLTDENNGDDTKDSDVDQSTEKTSEYVLQSNDHIRHVDIGLYKLTTIGDYVWNDLDADGKQETGEPGIAGIEVTLHKTNGSQVESKITTGSDGLYQFSGIAPGEYYVQFKLPNDSKFVATERNATSDDNDSDITEIDTYNFKTHSIAINTNEIDETLDAGFYIPAKLGDFVWEDMNGNGLQDIGRPGIPDEPGVGGVEIELFNGSASTGKTTTTAADGSYSFSDLEPGTYHIKVISLPDGYNGFITKNKGSDDTIDSDADNSGVSESVVLISGSDDEDLDIGIYKYTSIGNFVWEDLNADGIQDGDETFIKDSNGDEVVAQVNLFKSDESPEIEFNTTTTNGIYSFTDLIPGEYRVEFELLPNYYISAQHAVGNIETDSNPDKVTGKTATILLESGVPDNSIDCGMYKSNSIGNKVWHDENGNGIQDDSEGVADIEVRLYDSSGNYLNKSDLTDANGEYLFSNLEQGSYRIGIADKKEYTITTKNVDGNTIDDEDSDIDKDSMISDSDKLYVLTSNTHIDTADIGLYILGSIGNYVWEDMNGDGEQGDTEPYINDITVKLYKNGSKVDECTAPLTDGNYLFSDLAPGTYEIRFSKPTGYHFTTQNTVSNSSDSDVDENGEVTYTLKSNENNMKLDAGLVRRGDIGDYVWNDSNKNGIQDTNEQGLEKYKVKLIYSDGNYQETETNATGYYEFTDLQPGEYQVQFYPKSDFVITKENEGTDDSKDSNPDPNTGITPKFSLMSGNDVKTIDAGMYFVPDQQLGVGEGSIGDYVWIDYDKDGIQDSSEKGVEGVKVILSPKNAERIETYTDSNGKYLFDLLPDGLYSVRVEEPAGYKTTIRNAGSNKDKDSDANQNGYIEVVRLTNSADIRNIDIGLIGTAELGDFVWDDLNSNGSQDFGEPGVENVTVYLLDNNKNAIMQTKTDSDGKYQFTELVPGIYYVEIEIPYMYEMTLKNSSQEYKDSNGSTDGMSDDVYLNPGQKRSDIDFGIKKQIPEGEIGNYIWADCSDDGVQDSFEDGVPNITVKLLDKNKTVVDTTTTDNQGYYLFTNVYEGEYYIEVVLPGGISTAKRYAASESNDSNANADGLTGKISLAQKQKDMSIDIGLVKYGDIEGIITDDETGEPLANVDVVVKNRKGRVITTVTTDADGKYKIENISMCMEISLEVIEDSNPDDEEDNPDQEEETYEETPVSGGVDVPDDNTVTEGEEPSNGEVVIDEDGNWKYTPDPGFTGKDTFSIIITDEDGNEEEIFIEIDVEEIPLGTIKELPKTGASRNIGIYILGFLCILVGIILKKKLA